MEQPTSTLAGDEEAQAEEPTTHEAPRGALVITLAYLALLTMLWLGVYLQLLSNGGVPQP